MPFQVNERAFYLELKIFIYKGGDRMDPDPSGSSNCMRKIKYGYLIAHYAKMTLIRREKYVI